MRSRPLGCLFEVVETLVLTVVIFLVIQNFVAQPYRVEMESMERTLEQGQYVLVDKLTPRFSSYSRGDIVVFTPPASAEQGDTPFIKRVIGLPGDHVELKAGYVYVNGVKLDEPYIFTGQKTEPLDDQSSWDIGKDMLFLMGDHRENSTDSRAQAIGPVKTSDVIGRAWLRYWPIPALKVLDHPSYAGVPSAPTAGGPVPGAVDRVVGLGAPAAPAP